jgi:hypothetical protein
MQNLFQDERSPSDIFLLIKGLTQSEKAYYKKMAKRHADQNTALHMQLFKLIERSELQDDCQLCESLKLENKIHFSGIKSYLYKDVLDTLVFQKRNNCVDTELYFMMEQINSLQEKNLVDLAQKVCKKAIALAEKFQKYHYRILLIHLQNRILEFKDYKQFNDTSRSIFSKLQQAVFLQKIYTENRFLYERARSLTYRTWLPITPEELVEIGKVKVLLEGLKPTDDKQPLILLFYLNTLALCRYMFHETNLCIATCVEMAEMWKAHPHLINEYPLLFLNSVNTTCYNNFLCKNITKARDDIDAYAQLVKKHLIRESYRKHFEIILFNTVLKIHLKSAEFCLLEQLLDENLATVVSRLLPVLSSPEQLSVKCSVCISFFVLEKLEEAEHLLSVIKEQNRSIRRDDILYFCLLFDLVILYEQGNWDQLDSNLKTAYHFLYARKKLRPFERDLMLFLGHLADAHSKVIAGRLISNYLKTRRQNGENPDENLYLLYFNYYGWLESKLMKIRYMDYVKQQV